jgi:hypothetical protein
MGPFNDPNFRELRALNAFNLMFSDKTVFEGEAKTRIDLS